MRLVSFSQIAGLSALLAIQALCCAFAPTASADDAADIRPTWMGDANHAPPANMSVLSSTQAPSFLGPDFQTKLLGQKNIDNLKQDYLNQNRDYDMRQSYGLNTTVDEQTHENNMQGFGHQVLGAARNTTAQQYARNAKTAEDNGEVSQPLVYGGAVVAFGMGTPVSLKLGKESKATWNGDLMRQHGQLDVQSPIVGARFEIDAKTAAQDPTVGLSPDGSTPERYRVSLNRPLPLKFNSSVVYGSTSSSFHANLSHPIIDHIGASIDTVRPVGENISGAPPGETVGLSYGLVF
jgi:hypothetical protein